MTRGRDRAFFFFSSRRRHTGFSRDWSSDVCSSELRGRIRAVRFDMQNCKEVKRVDDATGVPGLTGALAARGQNRIRPKDASGFLAPPKDLARWARTAMETEMPNLAPPLKVSSIEMRFPDRDGQRVVSRALVSLPA